MEIALGLGLFGYFLSNNKKDNEKNISNSNNSMRGIVIELMLL